MKELRFTTGGGGVIILGRGMKRSAVLVARALIGVTVLKLYQADYKKCVHVKEGLKRWGPLMAVSLNHRITVCVIFVVYFNFLSLVERVALVKSYNLIDYAGVGRISLSWSQ